LLVVVGSISAGTDAARRGDIWLESKRALVYNYGVLWGKTPDKESMSRY